MPRRRSATKVTVHGTATATPHTTLSLVRFLRYTGSGFAAVSGGDAGPTIGAEDLVTGFFLEGPST